jgi:hypothetical protein
MFAKIEKRRLEQLEKLAKKRFPYEEVNQEWSDYCLKKLLEFGLSYHEISLNNNISWKTVELNGNEKWHYKDFLKNPNVTWDIFRARRFDIFDCDFRNLNLNPNITWEIVQRYDKIIYWCYFTLSSHPNITWKIVCENSHKKWNYRELSSNRNITWEIVQANPDKPWCYSGLSKNPNITWEIVQANPDKPWNYGYLSKNPNITWEIVQSNPDKPWEYDHLSLNPNITWEIVQSNKDLFNFDIYDFIAGNSSLRFETIENHLDNFLDYKLLLLAGNDFTLEKEMFFRKKLREWFKKSNLKKELIAKLWHPKNYEKFKYYDPEMFSEEEEE